MSRPTKDEYSMNLARAAGELATCDRGKSGAAIIDSDNILVSTGYVGAARGLHHCDKVGHLIHKVEYPEENGTLREHCVRTAHAETNAIIHAARPRTKGTTIFCKMVPCMACAVAIINAGIVRVVAEFDYRGSKLSVQWFRNVGVELVILKPGEHPY